MKALKRKSVRLFPAHKQCQVLVIRALQHGYKIKLLETVHDTIGVGTPEDLRQVEDLLAGVR